jgi:hypothetical protein
MYNNNFIILLIKNYIKLNDYINLYKTSKNISEKLQDIPYHIKYDFCKNKLNKYPSKFFDYFNIIKLYKTKQIDLGNRVGHTQYIDFINLSDFKKYETNTLRGIDIYNRPFLSLLYNNNKILTLFQRYSDNKYNWTIGGDQLLGKHISSIYFNDTISYEQDEPINIIKDLFNNDKTSYNYTDYKTNLYVCNLKLCNIKK